MGVFIIAEAGVNHNGDINIAKMLIDVAVESRCNAIKFQTFKADKIVVRKAEKAEYQKKNTNLQGSQYDLLKKLELTAKEHNVLFNYCKEKGIMFLSTPFDEEAVDLLNRLDMKIFKIPSGEITNKPLLKYIAKKNKPIILSTGMSTLGEVEEAIEWIRSEGNNEITLLHCTSDYPTKVNDVNLKSMITLKEAFKLKIGYSDHTQGTEISCAAVALGAEVIEKHFTLNRNMEGVDHKASLEPDELKYMVSCIRNIENSIGDGIKKPTVSELSTMKVVRKSIVAQKRINIGDIITKDMLAVKRPGLGIEPKHLDKIIGKKVKRIIQKDELISFSDLDG